MKKMITMMLLLMGPLSAARGAEQTGQTVDTFVFVGELMSIEKLPDPCAQKRNETGELDCITMDALYRARYRVEQPVAGNYPGAEITFGIADHYGFPPYAYFRHALLFVGLHEEGPWLHKYQAIAMHRTADGQWASCGGVEYRRDNDPVSPVIRPLVFEADITPAGQTTDPGWVQLVSRWKESAEQDYVVEGGTIRCNRGVLLPDAYDIVRNGVMKARGVALPSLQATP